MTTRVRAMYDFNGEPNTAEISIRTGDILILTRTDVGEGWWEGTTSQQQTGLFPEAYVEIYHEPAAAAVTARVATPPISQPSAKIPTSKSLSNIQQQQQQQQQHGPRYDQSTDDWNEQQDEWDDDWDEDNETYSEIGPPPPPAIASAGGGGGASATAGGGVASNNNNNHRQQNYANINLPPPPNHYDHDSTSMTSASTAPASQSKKNPFIFAKSGDSYILGTTSVSVNESERVVIVQNENGYFWKQVRDPYTVRVASPKKETKFKGMKSFIAYQLTPSFNHIAVSRRYKHFDWLHERLVLKFALLPIPPLPDKQISGRYEEQFIEHRRNQLQEFVDWVCRHPVLSICEVWMHFLTCTDEKKWKIGKRTAERDPLTGVTYCAAIFPPDKQLLQSQVDSQTDNCNLFVHSMDGSVRALFTMTNEQIKRYQLQWKKDFQRVGENFSELARALEIDERRAITNINLSKSVGHVAAVYINIAQLYGDQPKNDWIPFCDRLHIYRGILAGFPDVLSVHKGGMQKRKECEKLTAEQKMGNGQLAEVNRRTDIMSYGLLAEMNHFRQERDTHLKVTIRNLIASQIQFYQDIIVQLEQAQTYFE